MTGPGSIRRLRTLLGLVALGATLDLTHAFDDHVFVVTSDLFTSTGNSAAFDIDSPWSGATGLEPTSTDTIVRHFFGRHYVVHRLFGEIQVIDPNTFATVTQFSVGATSNPRDIVVVDHDSAYVSRHASQLLYEVDPTNGDLKDTIDLGLFADEDGIPEMAMMALDGNHLFVQIQRLDPGTIPVPPSYLAVVDVRTNQLVDTDPAEPGVQAIELSGLAPDYKMQIESRRLYVSEPGEFFDPSGGIEEIDLDSLEALGFITTEAQLPLQMTGFVLVSPTKGFALTHTDFALSSHLQPFSRVDGSSLGPELTVAFGQVDYLGYDPETDQLFFPDPGVRGVWVFDATTHDQLTHEPIDTGLGPLDLVIARATTPGEATDLRVQARDPLGGGMSIDYTPACGGADHTIVYGPLESVDEYAYSGQVCGLGNSGEYAGFDPGTGSYFFLVIANDGLGTEGSYGTGTTVGERPESLTDPGCDLVQSLARPCDGVRP